MRRRPHSPNCQLSISPQESYTHLPDRHAAERTAVSHRNPTTKEDTCAWTLPLGAC